MLNVFASEFLVFFNHNKFTKAFDTHNGVAVCCWLCCIKAVIKSKLVLKQLLSVCALQCLFLAAMHLFWCIIMFVALVQAFEACDRPIVLHLLICLHLIST
jgi:hypothetical protein